MDPITSHEFTSVEDRTSGPLNSRKIGRLAGVSQSTVSRVLSGHPHVAEKTRQRVLDVIATHRFVPNTLARSLVTRKSRSIGLVVSNITNHFYPELIEAVCTIAAEKSLSVILCNTQQDPALQRDSLRLLIEQRVAGILMTSVVSTAPFASELVRDRFPLVLINRRLADVHSDAVIVDNHRGAILAVNHFLELGHRRIAFVGGLRTTTTSQDRERGYHDAHAHASIPLDPTLTFDGDYSWAGGRRAADWFAAQQDRPTAALCADDTTALGFVDGLASRGIRVPDDCAVIGFDDIREAAYQSISLTTIRQPVVQMAGLSMDLLERRLEGDLSPPQLTVLPAELIVRRSSGGRRLANGVTEPSSASQRRTCVPTLVGDRGTERDCA